MKRIRNYYIPLVLTALLALTSAGCKDHNVPDTSKSIFDVSRPKKSAFDEWLYRNYVQTYNIDYKYRMDDKETDLTKNLAPAELINSMRLAKIIKHVWLEAYVEVAGIDFMRKHAPAILHIVGSAAWNGDGTITLGTAEGGLKITLYMTNWLNPKDIDSMNRYFFKTMHHEFTHILQQDVNYPQEYNLISAEDYRPSGWHNRHNIEDYAKLGFITDYAGSMAVEDITELTCCYVTFTDKEWQDVFDAAGEEGRAKLNQKLEIMKGYMKDEWNIDMDELKEVVRRRMNEVVNMDLLEPSWLPVSAPTPATSQAALQILASQLQKEWHNVLEKADSQEAQGNHQCRVHLSQLNDILRHSKH